MQNLLGKMADLMGSLMQRNPPVGSASSNMRGDEMKLLVVNCRTHLTDAICTGKDCKEVIKRLTELDCPLSEKYAVLQVTDILSSNSKSLEDLKHITTGLAVIVKYAQHLIKKSEHRREQWRLIHFGNAVVQKKIKPMKGFETVLQQLGYTVTTPSGLAYPNGVEPNLMVIINLIADMMVFRKEIKEYMYGGHPHPQHLQLYIPLLTQQEVQATQLSGLRGEDEDLSEGSSTPISILDTENQKCNTPVLHTGQPSNVDSGLSPDDHQPSRSPPECNNNSVTDEKFQTATPLGNKTNDLIAASDVDGVVARMSPALKYLKIEPECEVEQLQSTVVPGQAIQDLVATTNGQYTPAMENSSGISSALRLDRTACTVCGDEATVYCEDCTKKPLCLGCNINWHKHPQRQGHLQKSISVLDFMSPESINPVHIDGAYGISAQTNINPVRVSQKQQTDLVQLKALNKAAVIDDKLYSPEMSARYSDSGDNIPTAACYLPNQIQNEQNLPLKKTYNPQVYQTLKPINPQQHHQQQPLLYQQPIPSAGYTTQPVSYPSQVPFNNARFAYSGHMQDYLPSQANPGRQFRSDMGNFSPIMSQKQQLFDHSELMNNYHPDIGTQQQQHTLPYVQQQLTDQQRQAIFQQQQAGWNFPTMVNRPQNQYQYSQNLGQPHHIEDISYVPNNLSSMYQHANLNVGHQPQSQMFSVNPHHVMSNSGQPTRSNQPVGHQGTLLQGNRETQMNMQVIYNPPRGHAFHPTSLDVHQSNMFGGGNQQSYITSPAHYQMIPVEQPAYQLLKHSVSNSSSSSSLSSYPNPLIEQLKQVDSKKRCAKCDELIARLVSDIRILEEQINSAMEMDVDVCETDQFRAWNKQKALWLQQKKCLEEYRQQMDDETVLMKMNPNEEIPQQIHYPPDIDMSFRTNNRKLPMTSTSSEKLSNVDTSPEQVINVSDYRPADSNTNNSAAVTNNSTSMRQSIRNVEANSHSAVANSSQVKLAPTYTKKEISEITNMKRSSLKDSQESQVAVEVKAKTRANAQNSLPDVPRRAPIIDNMNILDLTFPPPKIMPVSDDKSWHCQHCTFINKTNVHLCAMCENPMPDGISHVERDNDDENGNEYVENLRRDSFLDMLEELKQSKTQDDDEQTKMLDENNDYALDLQTANKTRDIGSRICGSQEQVMLEKKRAQQEFVQQQQEQQTAGRKNSSSNHQHPSAALKSMSASIATSPRDSLTVYDLEEKQQQPYSHPQGLDLNEHCNSGSSDYHTLPSTSSSSPTPMPKATDSLQHRSVTAAIQDEINDSMKLISLSSGDSTLEDTLARFNEISTIDSMQVQGAEFVMLIKMADKLGFDVEAVQIALSFCDSQKKDPLEWLKKNWKKNVSMVVTMAIAAGNGQRQNSVGEVSVEEAESAYISCHGNMKDAVQLCVEKRTELYDHLSALSEYPREEILQVMLQSCGNKDAAERLIWESKIQPYLESIWAEKEVDARNRFAFDLAGPVPEVCHSFSTSIIFHGDFQKMIKDRSVNNDRRIRMIFVEGKLKSWGRAELVIKILDNDLPDENISLEDVVEAVRNCLDRNSALAYLQQECALCFTNFPMSKIRNLNFCQCKICEQCLTKNFEIGIREKHVRHWTCPLCSLPDMNDDDVASDYLQFLLLLLQPLIDRDLQNLFETKVRDWHLQKDVSFRWCAHCAEGFLAENQGGHLRMTCPHCQEKTCFNCKKQWEPQHEGLTCEQFALWKIDNDPTNQSVGLAKHLDENGIDCPTCKMRFALAKGGCMHFKCPQCGHEFCSGCNEPFHQKDVCTKYKICKNLGLHCHCPRDCFSYMRDRSVPELQQILKSHDVPFNINTPEDQTDPLHCPVMEQKEFDACKKDEKCGKETIKGQAGLCEIHYKEYLVYIINRHELDPVILMIKDEMTNLLRKYDIQVPKQKPTDTPEEYKTYLIKVIKEKLPLRKR